MNTLETFAQQYEVEKKQAQELLGDDFGISNFESMRTSEGLAYNCIVLYKGEPVGYIEEKGDGGPVTVYIAGERFYETMFDKDAQGQADARWEEICKVLGGVMAYEVVADALLSKEGF